MRIAIGSDHAGFELKRDSGRCWPSCTMTLWTLAPIAPTQWTIPITPKRWGVLSGAARPVLLLVSDQGGIR